MGKARAREEEGGGPEAPPERERGPPKPLPANTCRRAPVSGRMLAMIDLGEVWLSASARPLPAKAPLLLSACRLSQHI